MASSRYSTAHTLVTLSSNSSYSFLFYRLDRLILLLDQGSTPSVRLTAARQLGAIAAVRVSHPSSHSLVKVEDGPGESSTWRGVEGEWNEVLGLVARVSCSE